MQPISKKVYLQFIKDVDALVKSFGFTDLKIKDRGYIIPTSLGNLNITLWEDSSINYCIFMRFDLDKFSIDNFKIVFPLEKINTHTFKWNIHTTTDTEALDILSKRLQTLNLL